MSWKKTYPHPTPDGVHCLQTTHHCCDKIPPPRFWSHRMMWSLISIQPHHSPSLIYGLLLFFFSKGVSCFTESQSLFLNEIVHLCPLPTAMCGILWWISRQSIWLIETPRSWKQKSNVYVIYICLTFRPHTRANLEPTLGNIAI